MRKAFIVICAMIWTITIMAQNYTPTPQNLQARQEFQDMKFGIFIHWGIYSMLAQGEWVMNNRNIHYQEYPKMANGFYPTLFDANEWVEAIKAAGARYITFTSRHHDGFSMWHTQQSRYNIVDATPFKCDVIKELADACQRNDISLHLYYSHLDWGRTDYPVGRTGKGTGRPQEGIDWKHYYDFMNGQLRELLTQYGKIGCIWFDGWWDHDSDPVPFDWELENQYAMIHQLQPSCLIGNNHHQVPYPGEDIQIFERDLPGENLAGLSGQDISPLPLETCQTMNHSWGYNITDNDYKSSKEIIQYIVRAAGKNANLLLNIGPEPNGKLPEKAITRLKEIGNWMSQYGETIYGTRAGDVTPHPWGVSTKKGNRQFIHILDHQDKGLFIPLESKSIKKALEFKSGKKIPFSKSKGGITLQFDEVPTDIDYVVELIL